ncbi:AIPR family protein [Flavobacterium sp. CSZ]|uniref:AIPR family protein n=1 Tax=Flavobacterium sp. CSZ TaxID=2783791 RepID=UPI00188C3CC2|nr:AIPR family protein [Flavobacterium sp. CSZ]MBF4486216.1 AIPR family protein [Flavobacterium sp. CSZ]
MIDRITQSLLKDFQSKFDFEDVQDSDLFEHFVNYTILEKKLEDRLDEDALNLVNIGVNGTFGLDGFAILINKHLITSIEDLNEILNNNSKPTAEVFFIQSKTSNSFDVKEISSFGNSIEDFVSIAQKYSWNQNAKNFIELFKHLTNRANDLETNPSCHIFYCTLGEYFNDINTEAERQRILKNIEDQRVFNKVDFYFFDYNTLQSDYKKIGQKISRTFAFSQKTLIPDIDNVKEAYIGVVPATTIIDLIEEDSELISSIFYDNVRDFQGFNKINQEIKNTISDENLKYAFSVLNNGITIIAEKLVPSRDNVTISNYQIINGLQTSRVLLNSKEFIDDKIFVTLKLIVTEDENLISKIIRSTNRQTEVKEEDLLAYSDFQKKLEDFFKTFNDPDKLFYERRSKQYNGTSTDVKSIVDKSTLIKTMGSFYFLKPQLATRYFGALFNEFGKQLFLDSHKLYPYYTAALIYNKLENRFRANKIDRKYKKIRYFILMMLRLEYNLEFPKFESNRIDKYCTDLIKYFNLKANFDQKLKNVIQKIDSLNLDLESNELSKSNKLVDNIKRLYFK